MIINNVDDRRDGTIGSWEAEPLDYDSLGPEHVGQTIINWSWPTGRDPGLYASFGKAIKRCEAGTITSWRNGIVFARYSRGETAMGAYPTNLMLASRKI